ncbi:hypothetical protein DIPPA_15318 [Diplonema papillatum]|nr:hypothetical protein DIPPA_15318 [Diplonema papillatum]
MPRVCRALVLLLCLSPAAEAAATAGGAQAGGRAFRTLAEDCVWEEIDSYAECGVMREIEATAGEIPDGLIRTMCTTCLTTVQYYLGIDDLGVCAAFITWASALQDSCAELDVELAACPELTGDGCQQLLDLGIEEWTDGEPSSPLSLYTLDGYCGACVALLAGDLSQCPLQRSVRDGSVAPVCASVTATACFASEFPAQFPESTACEVALGVLEQKGLAWSNTQVSAICGVCLPFLVDRVAGWKPPACPDAPRYVVSELLLDCTEGSDTLCVADFLMEIAGCDALASVLIGFKAESTREQCAACLDDADKAIARGKGGAEWQAECAVANATLRDLRETCNAGGFVDVPCSDVMHWLTSNVTVQPAERGTESMTKTNTLTVTLTLSESTPSGVPLPPLPTPAPPPSPCLSPTSCACIDAVDPQFVAQWQYHLAACGLDYTARKRECTCRLIKEEFYAKFPGCTALFEQPSIASLCSACFVVLFDGATDLVTRYSDCIGGSTVMTQVHSVKAMCQEGGIGTKKCPAALLRSQNVEPCAGAFLEVVSSAYAGTPLQGDQLSNRLCANKTRCTTALLELPDLSDALLSECAIDVSARHTLCTCWSERSAFLAAAPNCRVLEDDRWKQSIVNFTRLCEKCLPELSVGEVAAAAYGGCLGRGSHYTTELIGNVRSVCSEPYLGVSGYDDSASSTSACQQAQDNSASCLPGALCRLEDFVPGCSVATEYPVWTAVRDTRALVCSQCVRSVLGVLYDSDLQMTNPALFEAVGLLQQCDAAWETGVLVALCQAEIDLCSVAPAFCAQEAVAAESGLAACDPADIEAAGEEWSLCLLETSANGQCECARAFVAATTACDGVQSKTDWLCLMRRQGCTGVPYPSLSAAACDLRIPYVNFNAAPYQPGYAICSKGAIDELYATAADKCLLEGNTSAACSCIEEAVGKLSEACFWDETGQDIDRLLCYVRPTCGAVAQAHVSSSTCQQYLAAFEAQRQSWSDYAKIEAGRLCSRGKARLAARAAAGWEMCGSSDSPSCACLAGASYRLRLLPHCVHGAPEWEALRCVASRICTGATPPDRPSQCHSVLANPHDTLNVAKEYRGFVTPSLFAQPSCDWSEFARRLADYRECLDHAGMDRGSKCACVVQLSWDIPVACKNQPSAAWVHVRCLASDLGCTGLPFLRAKPCDRFYAELHAAAGTEAATGVNVTMRNVPAQCLRATTAQRQLRACHLLRVSRDPPASVAEARGRVCGCAHAAYKAHARCAWTQPLALEAISCHAASWRCFGVPPPKAHCGGAAAAAVGNPAAGVCGGARAFRTQVVAPGSAELDCATLAAVRARFPFSCRIAPPAMSEYRLALCAAVAQGCVVHDVPVASCVELASAQRADAYAAAAEAFVCQDLAAILGEACAPLFAAAAADAAVAGACEGRCGSLARSLATAVLAACADSDVWPFKWIESACFPSESEHKYSYGDFAELASEPFVRDAESVVRFGNTEHTLGRAARGVEVGSWNDDEPVATISWQKRRGAQLGDVCTASFVKALVKMKGHVSIEEAATTCAAVGDARSGYEELAFCLDDEASWDPGIVSGIEAACAKRCYRKVNVAEVASSAPRAAQAERLQRVQSLCARDPSTGDACMVVVRRSLEDAVGANGVSGQWFQDPAYPTAACAAGLVAFDQCRRSGHRQLCECVRDLSAVQPFRACMSHADVAPNTLCLLPSTDPCTELEFATEYATYCSPAMLQHLQCLELMWNPAVPCEDGCALLYRAYAELWGCCAVAFEEYVEAATGRQASLRHVRTACGIVFAEECGSTGANVTFSGRLVLNIAPTDFAENAEQYREALLGDVMDALAVDRRNVLALLSGSVESSFVFSHLAKPLSRGGLTLEDSAAGRLTSAEFFIVGDTDLETATLRKDFLVFTLKGFPLPRAYRVHARLTGLPLQVNTYLSSTSFPNSRDYFESITPELTPMPPSNIVPVSACDGHGPMLITSLIILLGFAV